VRPAGLGLVSGTVGILFRLSCKTDVTASSRRTNSLLERKNDRNLLSKGLGLEVGLQSCFGLMVLTFVT
jgi:hypothetical protein